MVYSWEGPEVHVESILWSGVSTTKELVQALPWRRVEVHANTDGAVVTVSWAGGGESFCRLQLQRPPPCPMCQCEDIKRSPLCVLELKKAEKREGRSDKSRGIMVYTGSRNNVRCLSDDPRMAYPIWPQKIQAPIEVLEAKL
eukprot:1679943-Pyramimonas_sp.AAC.1